MQPTSSEKIARTLGRRVEDCGQCSQLDSMLSWLLPVVAAATETGIWLPFPAEAGICTPPVVTLKEEKELAAEATTSFFTRTADGFTRRLLRPRHALRRVVGGGPSA